MHALVHPDSLSPIPVPQQWAKPTPSSLIAVATAIRTNPTPTHPPKILSRTPSNYLVGCLALEPRTPAPSIQGLALIILIGVSVAQLRRYQVLEIEPAIRTKVNNDTRPDTTQIQIVALPEIDEGETSPIPSVAPLLQRARVGSSRPP
ncbi:hypothetical protein TWF696_003664 [Orbilia brochopaga]|uniref:Uncharacterized protein n=1 Tax=Orbilia brochopaga TaxID=3140254 RepID=A0AAV9V3S4_9PEZI